MTFKDLKPGNPVYLLHRNGDIIAAVGKVTAVSAPRFPQTKDMTQAMQMVVDVTIDESGTTRTYTTPDTLATAYSGDGTVIATTRDGIIREAENIKTQCEEELAKTDLRRRHAEQCERIIAEWNPAIRERKAAEERFAKLETAFNDLKGMVASLVKELKG